MARSRPRSSELPRLLDGVSQPVYALDDEHRIVYCNEACLRWLGRTFEELQGRKCVYHSSGGVPEADAAAAALCPPPDALAGREASGLVASPHSEGRFIRRRARFIPLAGETAVLLAIVDREDLPEGEAFQQAAAESESSYLHERIRAFRRQMAGRYRLDRLIGDSPAMRQARAQAELAAASRASVLIVGPLGSGRSHTATAIHYSAGEASGPLVPLDCSVLTPELIRSTVLAVAARYSGQQPVARGTLLLADADFLPMEIQVDLARAFLARPFPLRLISTARRPLVELASSGEYREDLAAALSTLVIDLPPLSRRRADIPLLAQIFIEEANAKGGKQIAGLTPDALDQLCGYAWSGNLDELALAMQEAHDRAEGSQITVRDLPQQLHLAAKAAAYARPAEETIVLDEFLNEVQRELVERALRRSKGNKSKAAKLLGLTRPRLYRLMVQLGMEKPPEKPRKRKVQEAADVPDQEIPFEEQE